MDTSTIYTLSGAGIFLLIIIFKCLHIMREYERAVVFTLGRFWMVKGPGLIIIVPGIQQMVKVELRTIVMDIPEQDVISRDNVSVQVSAVVYFRVINPAHAVIQVENYEIAVSQLAQTTLRSVLGQHELDEMLAERTKLNAHIQQTLDEHADAWGIKINMVEIKHIDINENMVRAIARQAEAERERRAKIIHADGELQASKKLLEAAQILSGQAQALQLRYLQTLSNIAEEKNSTIIFPLPIEFLSSFIKKDSDTISI
jgi:regulator of protease activity HflC (stomatin/prohibitin superfamily)